MRRAEVENLDDLLTMLVFHANDLDAILKDLNDTVSPLLDKASLKISTDDLVADMKMAKASINELIYEIKNAVKE